MRLNAGACLSVRYPGSDCAMCVSACPIEAIALDGGTPELRRDCIGCGQCAASCPTSALQTDGFALSPAPLSGAKTILVDCWRVPVGEAERGTVRVPCLGGISCGWLLSLFDHTGERPIHLLDRGGCATCPAGAGLTLLQSVLAEARDLLTECGVPAASVPKLIARPGRIALAPPIPTCADAQPMGRRGFFRDLIGEAVQTLRDAEDDVSASGVVSLRQEVNPIERVRMVTALARIAARHGTDVPAGALPQISLSPCDAHGICAGTCPTGALRRLDATERPETTELRFHAALCVGCGQCARACPQRAIRLSPFGGRMAVDVLARWTTRDCDACGQPFVGAADGVCPRCTKEADLMTALFQPSL